MPESVKPEHDEHHHFRDIDVSLRTEILALNVEEVRRLLDEGANPQSISHGCCTLMAAKLPFIKIGIEGEDDKREAISKLLNEYNAIEVDHAAHVMGADMGVDDA